ncbi:phage baseplate assembly protein [Citrobacter freundii]|nr:phage baseplate assembly protein [Citrobacter freundii]EJD6639010.1 phage baseplate assembly protein [Citrobacter freundii]ELS5435971.1 phage baseplate assembly protein [Citrobacter freundii]ELW9409424.1 phage baseplate assembly protein [Citrobacter freundii]HEG1811145.1 phage baseplate assembly protein [Citrobacter freundii]
MGLNPANIGRTLEGIGRRLRLLVDRAVVRIVTDSLGRQNLQIQSLADSTNDDVERFQNYGLTSVPPVGSEALILAVGGRREGLVAIAVEDKRCRPKGLENGEVRLYHCDGQSYITLKKNGVIEVKGKSVNYDGLNMFEITTKQLKVNGPTQFTEDIQVAGKSVLEHFHIDGDGEKTSEMK